MKNGQCPKCNSSDVFKKTRGVLFGNGALTVSTGELIGWSDFESYVCVNCGYFENYIVDQAKLQKVQKKWTRVA
ncbi:MAG: hypothetical protein WCF84_09160 [Anaerolineae bacterium]